MEHLLAHEPRLFLAHRRIRRALSHGDWTCACGLRLSAESGCLSGHGYPAWRNCGSLENAATPPFRIFLQYRTDLLMHRALLIFACLGWLAAPETGHSSARAIVRRDPSRRPNRRWRGRAH